MTNCASHSRFNLFARRWTISKLPAFLSTRASVEPRNSFERIIADKVFSPKEAEPAPMTVIFVGSVMYRVLQSRRAGWRLGRSSQMLCLKSFDLTIKTLIEKDTELLFAPCLPVIFILYLPIVTSAVMPQS